MQQRTKVALKAREYNVSEWEPIPCDICLAPATDVHHIDNSFRWKRSNDIYNLSCLCRSCHDRLWHSWNTLEQREVIRDKVKRIINNIDERKELLLNYNYNM